MVAGEARDSFPCTVECSTQKGRGAGSIARARCRTHVVVRLPVAKRGWSRSSSSLAVSLRRALFCPPVAADRLMFGFAMRFRAKPKRRRHVVASRVGHGKARPRPTPRRPTALPALKSDPRPTPWPQLRDR